MKELISTEHLHFEYVRAEEENVLVLNDINISIHEGEFVAVLGHNGSGKSTLAKHFNAVLLPTGGKVLVDGIDTAQPDRVFDIRQRIGMVFQNPDNQIVATIVEEDVAFALENLGIEPAEIRKRVDDALKKVDMYEFKEHAPHQLSGGQKQRVAIAGIIAMRPECIVLDEPTAMLDPKGRREVLNTVMELNREHSTTIALITHYMDEAVHADRIIVVDHGDVVMTGTPREIFSQVDKMKELGLDVPQVTELCHRLKQEGLPVPDDVITEEECTAVLKQLLQ
ncbi:Energy-coupling factor transporter ATP-binding protein EcfA1 [uncultured Ruminococcus sp.]|uniref:Energy-coupling factor transporter ATPase n=1 Tax=Massiliimalia timonensis TaxID=1987501 RepID=A0A8J6P2H6_9FIRM|nr:energy-coupling factor transporter ATPase [Massiliimalia timonensis]MBC8609798.1 energy-coupling factor transporter ATPase [Massiliimalia timonensis]SCH24949.1 Energy-coupling factor transporter ATP-binding protein EcfA1 [uncultured Ruminococcus sp.]SCH29658.1 Energy-coupling factor transporter ATP-binding protein EcfA1 [uncultured Clostridium sp.]